MAKKYVYIKCGNFETNINLYMFSDLLKSEKVQTIEIKKKNIKNIFLKIMRKIHLSEKISKIINLPFKWIWYDLSEFKPNPEDEYYIIFSTDIFWEYDYTVLKKYSNYKNVKLVLILLDTIGVDTPAGRLITKIYKNKMWDYVFTYDPNDVEKYNFKYLGEHYYSKPEIEIQKNEEPSIDAYYIGALKPGRVQETVELYEYLQGKGVKAKFDVVKNDGKTLEYQQENFQVFEKRQPYSYALNQIQDTNCIIEILQKGQKAQTLKYFEAVCFNKKLLTNNQNVKTLSFYDEKYIKIFNTLEDIDIEWVKKKEPVDYGYRDEFSPMCIIENLKGMD